MDEWLRRAHVLCLRIGGSLDVGRLRIDDVVLLNIGEISCYAFLVESVVVSNYVQASNLTARDITAQGCDAMLATLKLVRDDIRPTMDRVVRVLSNDVYEIDAILLELNTQVTNKF